MAEAQTARPAGNIYDLGYRPYEGERLGRRYALESLYAYSLRAVFGIGRSWMNKAFPIGLALFALVPTLLHLTVAALAPATDFELVAPQDYFGYVEIVIALFVAVVAPELIGRDYRNRTLPLYFSRALSRFDYVSAKVAALVTAIFLVILIPQIFLLLGNAVATDQILDYVAEHIDEVPPILISSFMVALMMTGLSLAIAAHTPKRALATGVIIAFFVILTTVGRALLDTTTGTVHTFVVVISPLDVLEGLVYWVFDAPPSQDAAVREATLRGSDYMLFAIIYSAVSLGWLYRRFQRLQV